ncbi:hypothetical protein V1605_11975 [Enterobacter soli]|uniref:hypothetical protein n=1 Tax=Enterobacter soli TaxID=885040 RepID=UPI003754B3C2
MSFTVPYLSLRGGLLLLTAASLSFSSSHSAISELSTAATVCSPTEAALHRELLEAQRRYALLRAKNFRLRQQLLWAETQRDSAKAPLWVVRGNSITGDMADLRTTDVMATPIRALSNSSVQIPLRSNDASEK